MSSSCQLLSGSHNRTRAALFPLFSQVLNMAAELIRKAIAESPVIIFSKTYCPYCTKAKAALDSVGAKYTTIELDTRADGDAIQSALAALTGRRTVPNVFVGGSTIGGGDDTDALRRSGKLAEMVAKVGAVGRR